MCLNKFKVYGETEEGNYVYSDMDTEDDQTVSIIGKIRRDE